MRRVALWGLAAWPALLLLAPLRHTLESRMLIHMLLQFPLLLAAGAAAAALLRRPRHHGALGACLLLCCSAVWMVPAALDLALLDARMAALKYGSWWLAGLLLGLGGARLPAALRVFVVGNLAWMLASAGLLYEATPLRLCVSYLQDEQVWTGRGLVVLALLLAAQQLWIAARGRPKD